MAYAEINYGFGRAEFWGQFTNDTVQREFMRHANQCFGIRKSISEFILLRFDADAQIPEPWCKFDGAQTLLKHGIGDTIVWNAEGEKIKSEWDI